MANRSVNKKQALLARKEELLRELQYYDKRIEEAKNTKHNNSHTENDSSDSEQEYSIEISPSIAELKFQQSMLKTCLHATQELTSVQVLQSEVNILVEDPVYEGETQITDEGTWKEIIVECRVDLVPFSMSYYMHKPNRLFAPVSYRNLNVSPVKVAHKRELAKSVLSAVTTPSDAVEVFRNYARAHRSRRCSLARLAETYADSLYMEPMADGGYLLKCANILEVSWTLQNKWSPIAHFHHRLKFDVEYMDESYIKIITQAHRQLSDPAIDTDERTLLMAKIINTCLEAEKPTQALHESFEAESLRERRQTLDEEPDIPAVKSKDSEIMAPPKYPPKKIKPKGKENTVVNSKDKKRPSESNHEASVKRPKIDDNGVKASTSKSKLNKLSNKVNSKDINEVTAKKSNDVQINKCSDVKNGDKSSNDQEANAKHVNADPKTSKEVFKSKSNSTNAKKDSKAVADSKKSPVNVDSTKNNVDNQSNVSKTKKVTDVNVESVGTADDTDVNKKKAVKVKTKTQDLQVKKAKLTDKEITNTVGNAKNKKVQDSNTNDNNSNSVGKSLASTNMEKKKEKT
ncbi:uncharacterized protein LOC124541347 [Vanessa cardui]|uniref:uncharacterized protein LOC124541347 n=1 Tax=Vanessa cardui TaxID=171605 RepID=UPI001F1305E3|nr:uncharacterized protein LOC124541347 [Vanessa cardui]